VLTTFTFRVRNRPAALYKALGGFATNGVNMVKLESYLDNAFTQADFYADIMGHPAQDGVRLAMEELRFFSHTWRCWGCTRRTRSGLGWGWGRADARYASRVEVGPCRWSR
jgi:prephenate dehydratase